MSVKAILIIDEIAVNIIQFSFGFDQRTDAMGRPTQKPVFNGLQLTIETRRDVHIADWSFTPKLTKQLEIRIPSRELGGKTRKLNFYDCLLTDWKTDFSSTDSNPLSETLKITCAGVKDSNSDEEFSAFWRETFSENKEEEVTSIEEEPEFTDYYITDLEGNAIEEYEVGDKILLTVETKNRIGDSFDIHLDDKTHDFKHNGVLLKNDILKDYMITSDTEKIELEITTQS